MLRQNVFKKINVITIGSLFVLILVGSIVRSLGAGMGCPDWPKCFGEYVPPTHSAFLPSDYKEIFRKERIEKNERIAHVFASLGYAGLSEELLNDPHIYVEKDFDVTKAWIEYVNRLIGVFVGLLVFLNMVFSFSFLRTRTWIPVAGVLIFLLTGFQGWIGSLVVSTNLLEDFITLHLVIAFLILALLIWQYVMCKRKTPIRNTAVFYLILSLLVLFIPQILLGTGVRAIIDEYLFNDTNRALWVTGLDSIFLIHRSYSWLVLIGSIVLISLVRKESLKPIKLSSYTLIVLVVFAMLAGVGMVQFDFPFWLQPVHMILAAGIFATLFYLILRTKTT